MRAFLFCLVALISASSDTAFAQIKLSPKAAAGASEVRYFTSLDGFMDGNADVVLKETRQGKTITSAVLDVCYPAEKGSDRKDRFVANLSINGQTLTGSTQSIGDKLPVTIKLMRKPTGDTFEFKGQISIGQYVTEVTSSDNSDLSELEFQDNHPTDNGITAAPKDFTEVSPEAIGVRVKLDAALDFLNGLKGQDLEVSLTSLAVTCDALRVGEQTIDISVDPDRAAALIAKFKALPGVVVAGWTSGVVDMERAIRFSAVDWRDGGDKLNKDRLAATITGVLSRTLAAKPSASTWSTRTGKLKLTFKRPSRINPALDLTETVEVTALVASDKPGTSDRLMLWISSAVISTTDEGSGPKLNLTEEANGDEEVDPKDDNSSIDALAKEFKGQRWDSSKSIWK
jgi:hypothetical protein